MNILRSSVGRILVFIVVVPATLILCASAVAQSRPVTLAELGTRVTLSSAVISRDGKHIAVVASRPNYTDNRFERSLVLVDATSGAQRVLTAVQGASSPQWSPNGEQLAWLAAEKGGEPQIHVVSVRQEGGRPVRITNVANVNTPALLLQNMGDPEVPYTGTYHFYHALRDNGAPVKLVIYPIQGHGYNGDPVHQRDTLRRWLAWIDEHFRAPAPGK